jgi:hypothetical protein
VGSGVVVWRRVVAQWRHVRAEWRKESGGDVVSDVVEEVGIGWSQML